MREQEQLFLRDCFHVYHTILEGSLQPHFLDNRNPIHIEELYQEELHKAGKSLKGLTLKSLQGLLPPAKANNKLLIKHEFLKIKESSQLPSSLKSISLEKTTSAEKIQSFYVYLVEGIYNQLKELILTMLQRCTSKEIADFGRRSLQIFKYFEAEAQAYHRFIKESLALEASKLPDVQHHSNSSEELKQNIAEIRAQFQREQQTIIYIVNQVLDYLHRSLLLIRENSELFFQDGSHSTLDAQRQLSPFEEPIKQSTPSLKVEMKPILQSWVSLFKTPDLAQKVLHNLREDNFITADGAWQIKPLRTMVALFLVLKDRGYLAETYYPAEVLAHAFNKQFRTDFGSKSWQQNQMEHAEIYMDKFGLIPDIKNTSRVK